MPVEVGDVLELPEAGKWKPIPVQWRQKFKAMDKNYYRVDFHNTRDDPEQAGILFVSEEKLDEFKSKKTQSTDTCLRMTVDDDFVYGQQKSGKNRFLVYHDLSREIFQHRFVEGTLHALSKQAAAVTSKLGYDDVQVLSQAIAGSMGHPLRRFS